VTLCPLHPANPSAAHTSAPPASATPARVRNLHFAWGIILLIELDSLPKHAKPSRNRFQKACGKLRGSSANGGILRAKTLCLPSNRCQTKQSRQTAASIEPKLNAKSMRYPLQNTPSSQALKAMSQTPSTSLDDPILLTQWFAIAFSHEIPAGQLIPRRLLNRDLVLWRSADQTLHTWRDLCIHRGARLSLGQIKQDCVVCPYHAWHYAPTGQCVLIPAQPHLPPPPKARAETYATRERYGIVWVSLTEPTNDPPAFPLADSSQNIRLIQAGPYTFKAHGPRILENLYDVAHLGQVHAGLLGDPQHLEIEDYEVSMTPQGPRSPQHPHLAARPRRHWHPRSRHLPLLVRRPPHRRPRKSPRHPALRHPLPGRPHRPRNQRTPHGHRPQLRPRHPHRRHGPFPKYSD
jgi:nitrite reductase/ring-hydroxylating ferredoxin subunit